MFNARGKLVDIFLSKTIYTQIITSAWLLFLSFVANKISPYQSRNEPYRTTRGLESIYRKNRVLTTCPQTHLVKDEMLIVQMEHLIGLK